MFSIFYHVHKKGTFSNEWLLPKSFGSDTLTTVSLFLGSTGVVKCIIITLKLCNWSLQVHGGPWSDTHKSYLWFYLNWIEQTFLMCPKSISSKLISSFAIQWILWTLPITLIINDFGLELSFSTICSFWLVRVSPDYFFSPKA